MPPPGLTRELAVVIGHFFPDLSVWLGDVSDPRPSGQVAYPAKVLLLLGILMFLSHAGSRNHFNDHLRDAIEMAQTLARLLGCEVAALPHLDTLEKVIRRIPLNSLEPLLAQLIRRLIRMKALDDFRVNGRFLLAIDGTGLYSFHYRHCEHCIETHHTSGAITYSHKVLVAFIVSADGYALPIACEFIENPGAIYNKQDCEIKAFHRLAPKIKRLFPQTAFWLLLDALYADQNVMRVCRKNGWNFAITFLDSDMPALWAEAHRILALSPAQRVRGRQPDGSTRTVRWVNDLDYHGVELSAVFQTLTDGDGQLVQQCAHLIGRPIDHENAWNVATSARQRWRCENEGFNVLKNGGFALEHVYSRNPNAAKGYVLLMLCAHTIQQLLTRGRLGTVFHDAFQTLRAYGHALLEDLRHQSLPSDLELPGQIRLSTA